MAARAHPHTANGEPSHSCVVADEPAPPHGLSAAHMRARSVSASCSAATHHPVSALCSPTTHSAPLGAPGRWNPCCSCLFSALPDALIAGEILSYLPRRDLLATSAVSTRFNYLVESPPLWRSVSEQAPSGVGLGRLLAFGDRATHTSSLLARRLLVSSPADVASLQQLTLPRLTDLDLSGSKAACGAAVTDLVLRHASTLRRLVLDGVTTLSDDQVLTMLTACTSLRYLSLAHCAQLTDACLGVGDGPSSSDGAGWLCRARLVSLDLNGCSGITGQGVQRLLEGRRGSAVDQPEPPVHPVSRLRSLRLRGISRLADPLLVALASAAPLLGELDIGSSNPFGSGASSRRGGVAVPALPTGADGGDDDAGLVCSPDAVTDAGLLALARRCRGIVELRLQGQDGLTDGGIALALNSALPHVSTLDLRGCRAVARATVSALAASHPTRRLESLRLFGCHGLRDAHLALLVSSGALRGVVDLDLYGCKGLSAAAVSAAAWALQHQQQQHEQPQPLAAPTGARPSRRSGLSRLWVGAIPAVRAALAAPSPPSSPLFPPLLQVFAC